MNRRPLTALLLTAVLVFATTGFDGCEKGDKTPEQQKAEFVAYAKDIQQAFVAAGPLIAQLKPNLAPIWNKGTVIAGKILVAVEASNEAEASQLLVELMPIFTEVAAEFTDNTKVLVVLLLADIGLRFFASHYKVTSASGGRPSAAANVGAAKVRAFASRPKWRCRDSSTGKYAKIEVCRANPGGTQIETR